MKTLLSILLLLPAVCLAQIERVDVGSDKTVCLPADTLWFKVYLSGPEAASTSVHAELYNDSVRLIRSALFPAVEGKSLGQLVMPKEPGRYWLRCYTLNSQDFVQSLTVQKPSSAIETRVFQNEEEPAQVTKTNGLTISSYADGKTVVNTLATEEDSPLADQPIKIVIKNFARDTIAMDEIQLHRGRPSRVVFPAGNIRGVVYLLFYHLDSLLAFHTIHFNKEAPVEITKDSGRLAIQIKDSALWNYSVSVSSDTGMPAYAGTFTRIITNRRFYPDTVNLSYNATAAIKKKPFTTPLTFMLQKDSTKPDPQVLYPDSLGRLSFSGLFFYDTAFVYYGLNGKTGKDISDVNLSIRMPEPPMFIPPSTDSYVLNIRKSVNTTPLPNLPHDDSSHYLQGVVVKTAWQDRNKWLAKMYVNPNSIFAWPAHYDFNLLNADTKYFDNIIDYLKLQCPGFNVTVTRGLDEPATIGIHQDVIRFFLDENPVSWPMVKMMKTSELAYAKLIDKGDVRPYPIIVLYTRNEQHMRLLPGQMQSVAITGYTKPLRWHVPDRTTLFWEPYVTTNTYKFDSPNLPYKITIQGVNQFGETLLVEKIIKP